MRATARAARSAAVTLAAGALLAGCVSSESLVGIRPAPTERTDVAPVDESGARTIVERVLSRADAVRARARPSKAQLESVLTGSALRMAVARVEARAGSTADADNPLAQTPSATVSAVSKGSEWPRAILASTLDEQAQVRYLHVLVSESASAPYRLAASVPMLPGSQLPTLGVFRAGAPLVGAGTRSGLPASPNTVLKAYAAALAQPKPTTSGLVTTKDSFAQGLATSYAAQKAALGKLGTVTEKHELAPKETLAFRLADGGAVVFGRNDRTYRITAGKNLKEFGVPAPYQKVVGKKKATTSLELTFVEAVVTVVPVSGPARTIGAVEQVTGGSAT